MLLNSKVKGEVIVKIIECLKLNNNGFIIYQSTKHAANVILGGKIIAFNDYNVRKLEKLEIKEPRVNSRI